MHRLPFPVPFVLELSMIYRKYRVSNLNKNYAGKQTTLAEHARLHAGSREFKCALCTYSTKNADKLDDHQLLHRSSQQGGDSSSAASSPAKRAPAVITPGFRASPLRPPALPRAIARATADELRCVDFKIWNC